MIRSLTFALLLGEARADEGETPPAETSETGEAEGEEADILSRCCHPFIVTLYHRFQDERNLYLLEEFVQGGTLSLRESVFLAMTEPKLEPLSPGFGRGENAALCDDSVSSLVNYCTLPSGTLQGRLLFRGQALDQTDRLLCKSRS